jgi:cytochrome c553
MKLTLFSSILLMVTLVASNVQAASIYAGKSKAATVCSQCHSIRRPSADAPFPSLAGQNQDYLKKALKEYRDKTRVSDIMNAIAGSLTDRDINNIAAYYSQLKTE